MEFKSKSISTKIGGNKSNDQSSEKANITKFYNTRKEIIKFYVDCFKMIHKAPYNANRKKVLKK